MMIALFTLLAVFLVACGNKEKSNTATTEENTAINDLTEGPNLPVGLKAAQNPAFPVGSKVILNTNHMTGMEGAEATVVAAYDTTAYAVSYKPTTDQPEVQNHKWVVHEELTDVTEVPYAVGDQVVLATDHLEGMRGATATIDEAKQTTVYMVDYTSTTGEDVKNHRWVTEDELIAK